MGNKLLHLILVFCFALLLSACGNEPCKRECDDNGKHCRRDCGAGRFECVEADDWGYPKVWVPADTRGMVTAILSSITDSDISRAIGKKEDYAPLYDQYFLAKLSYISSRADGIVSGNYPEQSAKAIDSHQVLIDKDEIPLVMTIGKRNQWTSWFGGEANNDVNGKNDPEGWDGGRAVPNKECQYKVTNGAAPSEADVNTTNVFPLDLSPSVIWAHKDDYNDRFYLGDDYKYYTLGNIDPNTSADGIQQNRLEYANGMTPCQIRFGMGLYVGFAPDDGSSSTTDKDVIFSYHIPDSKRPGIPNDPNISAPTSSIPGPEALAEVQSRIANANNGNRGMDGYLVRGFPKDEVPGSETGDRLFFKIVDRYYDDNEGGYMVKLKEGTRNPNPGPLETVVNFVIDPVQIIMRRIYDGIVSNRDYVNMVRATLVLYIAFYGFKWMMGMGSREEIRKDAVIRMLKIAIIAMLIGPESWDFFYNNLFAVFTKGVTEIGALLLSPFTDYDPKDPWYSMDRLLAKFFSAETASKIGSTLFSNFPLGIIYVHILYLAIILFCRALVKALIVYIVAFIAIAILITLAPIFIIFMLFDKTKHLLEEWWNQLIAFGVQQIILMTALGMFAALIVMYMERTIGYTVCWNVFADIDFIGVNANLPVDLHIVDFRFWMPDISNHMQNIWMDVDGDGVRQVNPPEMAFRYVDLPYFDPIHDKDVIARYMHERDFLQLIDLLVFVLVILLMMAFMEFVPVMSQGLKGGSPLDTSSVFSAGEALWQTMATTAKSGLSAAVKWGVQKPMAMGKKAINSTKGNNIKRGGVGAGAAESPVEGGAGKAKLGLKQAPSNLAAGGLVAQGGDSDSRRGKLPLHPSIKGKGDILQIGSSDDSSSHAKSKEIPHGSTDASEKFATDATTSDKLSKTMFGTEAGSGLLDMADDATKRARRDQLLKGIGGDSKGKNAGHISEERQKQKVARDSNAPISGSGDTAARAPISTLTQHGPALDSVQGIIRVGSGSQSDMNTLRDFAANGGLDQLTPDQRAIALKMISEGTLSQSGSHTDLGLGQSDANGRESQGGSAGDTKAADDARAKAAADERDISRAKAADEQKAKAEADAKKLESQREAKAKLERFAEANNQLKGIDSRISDAEGRLSKASDIDKPGIQKEIDTLRGQRNDIEKTKPND